MNTRSAALLCCLLAPLPSFAAERVPVLIDTDIGTGIGDAFALGLAVGSHELDVRGITSVGADTKKRAMLLCRFLTMTGRRHIRVAAGGGKQPDRPITDQEKYHYHPDPLFGRTTTPDDKPAADFIYQRLKAQPGKVTIIALGPLTNVAQMLEKHKGADKLIRRIILLEENGKHDEPAMKAVLDSRVSISIVRKAAGELTLDEAGVKKVFAPATALTRNIEALYQMWDRPNPPLAKAFAVAMCFAPMEGKDFPAWYVERMGSLLPPGKKPSKFINRGMMPHRVHVAEDFETDIERFWWMSGKAEHKLLPAAGKRACRAVLTHDFDDLLMPSRQMYKAVIINPVPGPPMGKNTRLSFRYRLEGTDTLRAQIYSLTNGYHRHLVVNKVPQGEWKHATVDMTEARRPDGTGGPIGEGERIDDIQFYVDADAELIIDEIVLHDAAAEGEKLPFPKRVIYCGGFDTGDKAKHWPGDFDIVAEKGFFWKAARPVVNPKTGTPWVRLGLRGLRPLGEMTHLSFRYKMTEGDGIKAELANTKAGTTVGGEVKVVKKGEWARAIVEFAPGKMKSADEIRFLLPKGSECLLDDVLLYEPGR